MKYFPAGSICSMRLWNQKTRNNIKLQLRNAPFQDRLMPSAHILKFLILLRGIPCQFFGGNGILMTLFL
jgi:hypothetical protein